MKIDAVIFDMDGLMLDTERLFIPAIVQAANACGYPMTEAHVYEVIGRNSHDSQEHFRTVFGADFDYDAVNEEKRRIIKEKIARDGIPVKPGLTELLDRIAALGLKTTVATSTSAPSALDCLRRAGVADRFPAIITGDMVTHSKPDPQIYLMAAELLGCAPEHCAVLEDSPVGIESAARAGMYPIMVPDLIAPTEHVRAMTYAIVPDLFDARKVIDLLTEVE